MHTDLLAQHLFCDLLGLKQPVLYLFGQMTYALNDIPAAAIVRSNIQGQTGVVLRQRLGFANTLLETRVDYACADFSLRYPVPRQIAPSAH